MRYLFRNTFCSLVPSLLFQQSLRVLRCLAVASVLFCSVLSVQADYTTAAKAYKSGDYATAFSEYLLLAEAGDTQSQVNLGWMYYAGEGTSSDKLKALEWYRKAAEKGDSTALFNLGHAYENGDGVSKDLVEAHRWYSRCAASGDKASRDAMDRVQQKLSSLMKDVPPNSQKQDSRKETPGIPRSDKLTPIVPINTESKTQVPTRRSATANDLAPPVKSTVLPKPERNLTVAAIPRTTKKIETSRVEKIRLAAESGDIKAIVALGWIYSSGKEVPVDKQEAVKWYRIAAEKGEVNAQMSLGWLYFSGDGINKDLKQAAYWYRKAAVQGNAKAKEMLTRIR